VKREEVEVAEVEATEADSVLSDWWKRAAKSVMSKSKDFLLRLVTHNTIFFKTFAPLQLWRKQKEQAEGREKSPIPPPISLASCRRRSIPNPQLIWVNVLCLKRW
jgi:hypothetical protein